MAGSVERVFEVLNYLVEHPEGVMMSRVSSDLALPLSAAHRALASLVEAGFAFQRNPQGPYFLTMKLASLGFAFLSRAGISDVAQPILDALSIRSGELVRLAVIDGERLVFVAKAQGAPRTLRYDPDMGLAVQLSCSAAGQAWLATMDDQHALDIVFRQGFGQPDDFGPNAPTTAVEFLACLADARERGHSVIEEQFAKGMNSMSAVVRRPDEKVIGVITIAGPMFRLTREKMETLAGVLTNAAREIGALSVGSAHVDR